MKRLVLLVLGLLATPSLAEVTVGYTEFKPMAYQEEDGTPGGFDIELWEQVARRAELEYSYKKVENLNQLLEQVESGEVDIALSGISVTADREAKVNFSYPYFDSGLRFVTRKKETSVLESTLSILTNPTLLKASFYFFLFVFGCGHILWLAERGEDEAISDKYFPGIFEAFWCIYATMTTIGFGDVAPQKWIGRIAVASVGVVGITFFGWFASVFAASLVSQWDETVAETQITEPTDLSGLTLTTKKGTTSYYLALRYNFLVDTCGSSLTGYKWAEECLLKNSKSDGIFFDSPAVLTILSEDSENRLAGGDRLLFPQKYAFAIPQQSRALRKAINIALLEIKEDGTYQKIYNRYFDR